MKCQQKSWRDGLCSAHWYWLTKEITPDKSYEMKVMTLLIEPTWDWMTEAEAHAVIQGRYKGDGRRLDSWVSHDPVLWNPE